MTDGSLPGSCSLRVSCEGFAQRGGAWVGRSRRGEGDSGACVDDLDWAAKDELQKMVECTNKIPHSACFSEGNVTCDRCASGASGC